NNLRSLAAAVVTWRPAFVHGLSLGATRAVYAPADGVHDLPLRLFNIFGGTGHPNRLPLSDSSQVPGRGEIVSLCGRWVLPRDGVEVYFEWSRTELPTSLRDLLVAPNQSEGYTLGMQWAGAVRHRTAVLRFQTEFTYLEKSPTLRDRPEGTFY